MDASRDYHSPRYETPGRTVDVGDLAMAERSGSFKLARLGFLELVTRANNESGGVFWGR
jgi:hypothetical protein